MAPANKLLEWSSLHHQVRSSWHRDINFVLEAGPGCHLARLDVQGNESSTFHVLEWESVDPTDYGIQHAAGQDEPQEGHHCPNDEKHEETNGPDDIPDIAVDPEHGTLTLCNLRRNDSVVAYLTIYETLLRDADGKVLDQGVTIDDKGASRPCTTLIVLCPPCTFVHLCTVDLFTKREDMDEIKREDHGSVLDKDDEDWDEDDDEHDDNKDSSALNLLEQLQLDSDVQPWSRHHNIHDTHPNTLRFPLATVDGPFLCTQGEGGHLTHFFSGNYHALDFQCPIGTPLLSVAPATVVQVNTEHSRLTGIAVSNLFSWNSILLEIHVATEWADYSANKTHAQCQYEPSDEVRGGPLFVEYVHIATATVNVGDRVQAGQVIGTSGSIGFSPEPHLHLAAYRSAEPAAATVRVYFQAIPDEQGNGLSQRREGEWIDWGRFLPRAGVWYNATGPCSEKT